MCSLKNSDVAELKISVLGRMSKLKFWSILDKIKNFLISEFLIFGKTDQNFDSEEIPKNKIFNSATSLAVLKLRN